MRTHSPTTARRAPSTNSTVGSEIVSLAAIGSVLTACIWVAGLVL